MASAIPSWTIQKKRRNGLRSLNGTPLVRKGSDCSHVSGLASDDLDVSSGPGSTTPAFSNSNFRGSPAVSRSEEHTSELQSLMRISYAVFCLKNNKYSSVHTMTDKIN